MRDDAPETTATILDWVKDPGKRDAWQKFAIRYARLIEGWCRKYGLSPDDAEDVTQEILSRMIDKISKYDSEKGRFRDWLRTVTYNECMSAIRKRSKRVIKDLLEDSLACKELERDLDKQAQTEALEIAMTEIKAAVDARHWQCFEDTVFKPRSARELADELGMTVAAVHMGKYRVQQRVIARAKELGCTDDLSLTQ